MTVRYMYIHVYSKTFLCSCNFYLTYFMTIVGPPEDPRNDFPPVPKYWHSCIDNLPNVFRFNQTLCCSTDHELLMSLEIF